MSGRECSFSSRTPSENFSTPTTSSHERSISPRGTHSRGDAPLPDITPLTGACASLSGSDSPERPSLDSHTIPTTFIDAINLDHMGLLVHLIFDKEIFNLGSVSDAATWPSRVSIVLKIGLEAPYVLHQLLAFSACHLAYAQPDRSTSYRHQAVTLQTRAISLFNAAWVGVDRSNCVAVLLFSSILGHHLLADTLAMRGPGGLEPFMTHYVQCLEMHRGVYTIATTAWPLLMESELLQPILSWSSDFNARTPRGDDCRQLTNLVDGADGLDETEKDACRRAIRYLQVGFDAVFAADEQGNRYHMIASWAMLAPPAFTGLLAARRPEALVLLAYYALLLHHGRHMWQVRDAGAYIMRIVADHLGRDWEGWLEYPRHMIAKDSVG